MRLIGINGFKTAGKDTTYQIIKQHLTIKVVRRGFADKLKIMAALALGFTGDDKDLIATMDDFKESGTIDHSHMFSNESLIQETWSVSITGREYLQYFGANARKVFGDTFWIDQVLPDPETVMFWDMKLPRYFDHAHVGCITDVRYENEAERIKLLGGEIWEIIRPGLESDGHSSEIPLSPEYVDVVIHNNGTIADLSDTVAKVLTERGY